MAYATVAELANYLGLQDSLDQTGAAMRTQGLTDRYQLALDTASRIIDQDCGRYFTSRSATKKFIPDGSDTLLVPDLVSVTTIKVDEDDDGIYEETLAAGDYELNTWHFLDERWPTEYIVRLDDYWPLPTVMGRRRLVEIAGTWGWTSVPVEIKQACLIQAARLVQRSNAALGVQGVSDFGPFSIRNTDPDYLHLIQPFVKMGVA